MKTIGLIGGMSWESTVTYYQIINTVVKEQLGAFILPGVYYIVLIFMKSKPASPMGTGIRVLLSWPMPLSGWKGRSRFLVICTNTMHKVADIVQEAASIPFYISPKPPPRN